MKRLLLRSILGGVLGILMGENPIATGLIASPLFLPMLAWYVFLFLTFDWLIVRFRLSSGAFFLLAAIMGVVIGGILVGEFLAPSPEMGILGLDIPSTVLVPLWWGASYVLLFHLVNALVPRERVSLGAWTAVIFLSLTLLFMAGPLPAVLAMANPWGLLFLLGLAGVLSFRLARLTRSTGRSHRPMVEKDRRLGAILLLFIVITPFLGAEGYVLLSAVVVVAVLLFMARYRIAV